MTKFCSMLALAALAAGLFVVTGAAEDKKDNKVINTLLKETVLASRCDFARTYELPLEGLATVGSRIDQCRRHPDPAGLALIATELAAAEQVSGKKATITAAAIRKEAVKLAARRAVTKELKVVALLVKNADEAASKKLEKLSTDAAARDARAKNGEVSRGIGKLRVENGTEEGVEVLVNGKSFGHVEPGQKKTFDVNGPILPVPSPGGDDEDDIEVHIKSDDPAFDTTELYKYREEYPIVIIHVGRTKD